MKRSDPIPMPRRLFLLTIQFVMVILISGCGADLLNLSPETVAESGVEAVATNTAAPTQEEVALPTSEPTEAPPTPAATLPAPMDAGTLPGLIVYAMSEAGYFHLFGWHPETLAPTRLTYGNWDDIQPALSPNGQHIAFSSNRHGYWDLFILDLTTGVTTQFTDDQSYDGHPSWSSDGTWLAYEKFVSGNLDIYTKPFANDMGETRVTTDAAPDFDPDWQPGGNTLAFSSLRTGAVDILLVDSEGTSAPQNFTSNFVADQRNPVWTSDGNSLAWISHEKIGYPTLFQVQNSEQAALAKMVTASSESTFDPTGAYMLNMQVYPDHSYLSIQQAEGLRYIVLPTPLNGQVDGIDWGVNALPAALPALIAEAAQAQPSAPWLAQLIPSAGALSGRQNVIDLPGIKAPHPSLTGLAVEPFFALKDRANSELGWDVLSDLENLFVSITEPLPPDRQSDWLYTGRAFALNPVLIDYEYMLVVREDFGPDIFWRIYLKPLDQSGAMGTPLTQLPWDFDARFSGSPSAYENGGVAYEWIPGGYWVDFTSLAIAYGWERTPALITWQSYIQGARYNVFAITSGLDWEDAMLQIWPPEIFLGQN